MSFSKIILARAKCEHCGGQVFYQVFANYRELSETTNFLCKDCGFTWLEESKY